MIVWIPTYRGIHIVLSLVHAEFLRVHVLGLANTMIMIILVQDVDYICSIGYLLAELNGARSRLIDRLTESYY